MKFATIPLIQQAPSVDTGSPCIACFPTVGEYNPDAVAGSLGPFPVELTLADAAEFWWRIKRIQCVIVHEFFGTQTITLERVNNSAFLDERQLMLNEVDGSDNTAEWEGDIDSSTGGDTRTISVSLKMFDTQLDPEVSPTATNYYFKHDATSVAKIIPSMELSITGVWEDGGTEFIILGTSAYALTGDVDLIDADIHNHDVPFNMGDYIGDHLISITLTPNLFFTWANSDGSSPTWDSATGQKV